MKTMSKALDTRHVYLVTYNRWYGDPTPTPHVFTMEMTEREAMLFLKLLRAASEDLTLSDVTVKVVKPHPLPKIVRSFRKQIAEIYEGTTEEESEGATALFNLLDQLAGK